MSGVEKGKRRLIGNPRHRRSGLIGSAGLSNEAEYSPPTGDAPLEVAEEVSTEEDARITEAAKQAGKQALRPAKLPPPTEIPPADHVG